MLFIDTSVLYTVSGRSERFQATVYQKLSSMRTLVGDVYGVMPAQC